MISKNLTNIITKRLVELFQPQKIILFGSQARETTDARSDVDLLVVCPLKLSRRAMMRAMDAALEGLGIAVDIIVLSPDEFEIDRHIPGTVARPAWLEGKVLYEVT